MGERDELLSRLDGALAEKTIAPSCYRCRATRLVWLIPQPLPALDSPDVDAPRPLDGDTVARVCLQCGFLDTYQLALLLRGAHDASVAEP
jgi:hypothetical protein